MLVDMAPEDTDEEAPPPPATRKKSRAAMLTNIGAKKKTTQKAQSQLTFVPSQTPAARGATRKAATAGRRRTNAQYADDSSDE